MGYHNLQNAFRLVDFGENPHGINGKRFWLVSADAIHEPAMVVDNLGKRDDEENSLIVIEPRSKWPAHFIDIAE
jgi:hypothetical protein